MQDTTQRVSNISEMLVHAERQRCQCLRSINQSDVVMFLIWLICKLQWWYSDIIGVSVKSGRICGDT